MQNLKDILFGVSLKEVIGSTDINVQGLAFDSRKVSKGFCFIAQKGVQQDGHNYIKKAIELGAIAVVCEDLPAELISGITYLRTDDASKALGFLASNFYKNPSKELKLIGITGTNGKTTCATLLHQLFKTLGYQVGLISTVVNKIGEEEIPATHTTPDALAINALLSKMVIEGCSHVFMEVSSHGLAQERVAGLEFAGAVFTNITHEHLDFHKDFKSYLKAKQMLFDRLGSGTFALTNGDDKNGAVMIQNSKAKRYSYALKSDADYKCRIQESNFTGLQLLIDGKEFWSPLIGDFNAYNLTAVYATARLLGQDSLNVLTALSSLRAVAGRFQYVSINQIAGIVDYAHSPDALENVLRTIKKTRTGNEQVITVVGCGGDRDRTKRPLMAKIACSYSDRVILTSDNPRTENPDQIIEEMKTGVDASERRKVLSITQRREAIRTAASLAEANDIILVAGKGHETYQEINGERNHFDDMEELEAALNEFHQTIS